jgi:hypothetical protein
VDCNSQHQLWTLWTYTLRPSPRCHPSFEDVRENCARFGVKAFGMTAAMRVRGVSRPQDRDNWEIEVLAEGVPGHDPRYAEWMHRQWMRFFRSGFGSSCQVAADVCVMAGDRQDGMRPDQMIIVPTIPLGQKVM